MNAPTELLGYLTAVAFVAANVGVAFAVRLPGRRSQPGREVSEIEIGTERRRVVGLGLDELQQGVLIGGSPGAGKTTLLAAFERRLPERIGSLFIDLKGDRSLPGALGIPPERVFGLGDRCSAAWNPLDEGNPASWRDVLMSTQEWSEPHYRQAAARFVGVCLAALASTNGKSSSTT